MAADGQGWQTLATAVGVAVVTYVLAPHIEHWRKRREKREDQEHTDQRDEKRDYWKELSERIDKEIGRRESAEQRLNETLHRQVEYVDNLRRAYTEEMDQLRRSHIVEMDRMLEENRTLKITVSNQQVRIASLEGQVAELQRGRERDGAE